MHLRTRGSLLPLLAAVGLLAVAGCQSAHRSEPPAAAAPANALVAEDYVEGEATIQAIDPARQTVTLAHDVVVKDRAVQQRLSNLKAGDLVQITDFEAVAAEVVEKA